MTIRTLALAGCIVVTCAGSALAQTPAAAGRPSPPRTQQPTPAAAPQPPTPAPRREGQAINIKVEMTITDQREGGPALKKSVTVVTGDGMIGFIRSQGNYQRIGEVLFNIDTEPQLLADGKIRLRLNLQYDLPGSANAQTTDTPPLLKTQIRENLALILENGKSLLAAQSTDPVVDRQVTIEVKATVLR